MCDGEYGKTIDSSPKSEEFSPYLPAGKGAYLSKMFIKDYSHDMALEARDYSTSETTLWMRESTPGQFYARYVEYERPAIQDLLSITRAPESRKILQLERLLSEEEFYRFIDGISLESRMRRLRMYVGGYELSLKEYEARMAESEEQNPTSQAHDAGGVCARKTANMFDAMRPVMFEKI